VELIFGFIMCGLVTVAVHLYLRLFAVDGARHRPFEQWCGTHPLVMALRCQPGAAIEVYERLRRYIEPADSFANTQGRYPWQHYAVHLDGRRSDGDLVLLFVTGCRQPRAREHPPDLARAIEGLGKDVAPLVDEVWLHGHLHTENRRRSIDKERLAWLGTFEQSGELQVNAMIGRPPWLSTDLTRA